jgi:hypothetical protein
MSNMKGFDGFGMRLRSAGLVLALGVPAGAAYAQTHFFFDGVPLATLDAKGGINDLALGVNNDDAPDGMSRRKVNATLARQIKRLWSMQTSSQGEVSEIVLDNSSSLGCTGVDHLLVEGVQPRGVWASAPPRDAVQKAGPREATPVELAAAKRRLAVLLTREPLVLPEWRGVLLDKISVTALQVHAREAPTLMAAARDDTDERYLAAFVILTPLADGSYRTGYVDISAATSMDSTRSTSFISSADFDGDGLDEIILQSDGYESGAVLVLARRGAAWQVVARADQGGC